MSTKKKTRELSVSCNAHAGKYGRMCDTASVCKVLRPDPEPLGPLPPLTPILTVPQALLSSALVLGALALVAWFFFHDTITHLLLAGG